MVSREDKLADKLFRHSKSAEEVDPSEFTEMLETAEPGWTPIEEPENYRWFLINDFPVKGFNITMKEIVTGLPTEDQEVEFAQHDAIVALLEAGAGDWPAFVTSNGIIFDGFHRIAAHRTLDDDEMPVVIAVERPRVDMYGDIVERGWVRAWNQQFPE